MKKQRFLVPVLVFIGILITVSICIVIGFFFYLLIFPEEEVEFTDSGFFELSDEIRTYTIAQDSMIELIPINRDENSIEAKSTFEHLKRDVIDYYEIAKVINANIWVGNADNWKLDSVIVRWDSPQMNSEKMGVTFNFYQTERNQTFGQSARYESQISFMAHREVVYWKKRILRGVMMGYGNNTSLRELDFSESSFAIVESAVSEEVQESCDSQCDITAILRNGYWDICYYHFGESFVSTIVIEEFVDSTTGKIKKSK